MRQIIAFAIFVSMASFGPTKLSAQSRGTPTTPTTPTPQRGQRGPAKPPTPLTLRQVIEALSAPRNSNSSRVEEQVSKAGVQFQATPANLDILKQFGASAKLLSLIPAPV